jgi:hypothetical protein
MRKAPTEMKFSDEDIIAAAISAATQNKNCGIDLKSVYIELLDCAAYSKIYRFRYEIVSRQRIINLMLTNGFRSVGMKSKRMSYVYEGDEAVEVDV